MAMDENKGIILDRDVCRKFGFSRMTYTFFNRNSITGLKQLCDLTSEQLFNMRRCFMPIFTNIVEVLHKNSMHLSDFSSEKYSSIKQYIRIVSKNYIDAKTDRFLQYNLENCKLEKLEELHLPSRYITLFKKVGIDSVKSLLSYDRSMLKATKLFGDKSINEITSALVKHNLTIKGDDIYSCTDCSESCSAPIDLELEHFCPICVERRERLASIEHLKVSVAEMEYTSFTSISSGFDIYVNVKNLTGDLLKVHLKEMYIISQGRQYAPKFYLTGYHFEEEFLMPNCLKTITKIWDLNDFNGRKLAKGDELYITLFIPSLNKRFMYKFLLESDFLDDEWVLNDYFEV